MPLPSKNPHQAFKQDQGKINQLLSSLLEVKIDLPV